MVSDTASTVIPDEEQFEADSAGRPPISQAGEGEDEVIIIRKSLVVNIGIALVFFTLGVASALVFLTRFVPAQAAVAQAPAVPAQPTLPPARLDNVAFEGDPYTGPADAPIVFVEFGDFKCGFCKRFHDETIEPLLDEYDGQIRYVYRDFPVVGGQQAAEAAECANAQGQFWPYHDALYADPQSYNTAEDFVALAEELSLDTEDFEACYSDGTFRDEIAEDAADGREYGVGGTPTFFINGVRIVGAQPIDAFRSVIDQELGR